MEVNPEYTFACAGCDWMVEVVCHVIAFSNGLDEFCTWGLPWDQLRPEVGLLAAADFAVPATLEIMPFWPPVDLVCPAKVFVGPAANFGTARCAFLRIATTFQLRNAGIYKDRFGQELPRKLHVLSLGP